MRTEEQWISASLQYSSLRKVLLLCILPRLRYCGSVFGVGDASLVVKTQVTFLMRNFAHFCSKSGVYGKGESCPSPSFATEGKRSSENKSTRVFFRTVCS